MHLAWDCPERIDGGSFKGLAFPEILVDAQPGHPDIGFKPAGEAVFEGQGANEDVALDLGDIDQAHKQGRNHGVALDGDPGGVAVGVGKRRFNGQSPRPGDDSAVGGDGGNVGVLLFLRFSFFGGCRDVVGRVRLRNPRCGHQAGAGEQRKE
ncbi:hypothetical protein QQF73_02285 [Marinobacter sp. M216]|uniref:Uncharacterized protein n=1 Tax=Marinobacter albus TaxID=3030833 RepID=A0ABT7H7V2_9GAMM|nr:MULTISPECIES: hypothetical protein [unclassified Marinobacter]MBW7471284.1 hypothetical protein [Marinobacter sp. F4218]MDK9556439.1 hypothetical protein [Marinobacter sp. M216]